MVNVAKAAERAAKARSRNQVQRSTIGALAEGAYGLSSPHPQESSLRFGNQPPEGGRMPEWPPAEK